MKETFENLIKENIAAFVRVFKKEPNEAELKELRLLTIIETGYIGAIKEIRKNEN